MRPVVALKIVKALHTAAWTFFVGCILAIPYLAWQHRFAGVLVASGFLVAEIAVLALNSMRCPLTAVAARYTSDRKANFDIYIPELVARYNKEIFGTLLLGGWVYALVVWLNA